MCLRIALCIYVLSFSVFTQAAILKFCYEDKSLPPSYMGQGLTVPSERPGATIEILKTLDKNLVDVSISFTRKPWQRCLHELKQNRIDAVIASYRAQRVEFMSFPFHQQTPNTNLSVSQFGLCLVGNEQLKQSLINKKGAVTVAVPRGYSAIHTLTQQRFDIIKTDSKAEAVELVVKGLVDASIGLCSINNMTIKNLPGAKQLKAVYPPFDISYGYLAFSKQFYSQHTDLAHKIWQEIEHIDIAKFYLSYLDSIE